MKNRKMILAIAVLISLLLASPLVCGIVGTTTVRAIASNTNPEVGDNITVTIRILNTHELFNIQMILRWDPVVLSFQGVKYSLGVESNPDGVLHGNLSSMPSYRNPGEIYLTEFFGGVYSGNRGEYTIYTGSIGDSTPAFNGNGTLAVFNFTVANAGDAKMTIEPTLYSKTGKAITTSSSVDTITAATSSIYDRMPTVRPYQTPQPTTTPEKTPEQSPSNTSILPFGELGTVVLLAVVLGVVAAVVVAFRKKAARPHGLTGNSNIK